MNHHTEKKMTIKVAHDARIALETWAARNISTMQAINRVIREAAQRERWERAQAAQ